jgi:hypothetical protein
MNYCLMMRTSLLPKFISSVTNSDLVFLSSRFVSNKKRKVDYSSRKDLVRSMKGIKRRGNEGGESVREWEIIILSTNVKEG